MSSSEREASILGVEGLDLALERAHGVDRLVDLVEQALLFRVGVLQLADDAIDEHLLAAHQPEVLALVAVLCLRVLALGVVGLGELVAGLLLVLDQFVDLGNGGLDAGLQDLFGEFFLVEYDHFLDVANAALEVFTKADDFANNDRRTGDGLHDAHLAALDALGDFYFALASEQGNGAHLAQVHADGVVGLFERAGREVELDVVGLFAMLGL